jgi:putative phage-type endonuclease
VVSTPAPDREEWLELRRGGIGGSDAVVLAGLSPYHSAFELWLDKRGLPIEDRDSEAAEWGRRLEPVVAEAVAEREGCTIRRSEGIVRHPVDHHRIASLDGIADYGDDCGVYEGKTTSLWRAADWDDGNVPDAYRIQGQHYMGVTGYDWCLFGCLIGGQRLVIARVERDDDLIAHLWEMEDAFWTGVVEGTPPPPDGSRATTELLHHVWDVDPGKSVVVSHAETVDIIGRYRDASTEESSARERKAEAGNLLRLQLGDAEIALSDEDGRVLYTWKETPEKLIEAHIRKASRRLVVAKET